METMRLHIGNFGWSTEIRIPFHTLNFDQKLVHGE